MLGFNFKNVVSFPLLFPRFAFDTPGSFADYLIVFKQGIFSLREIPGGFGYIRLRDFRCPYPAYLKSGGLQL